MSLHDHARAARILGDAFEERRRRHTFDQAAPILAALSESYISAARKMEAVIKAEAEQLAQSAKCTVDHRTLPRGIKCGACGSPAG